MKKSNINIKKCVGVKCPSCGSKDITIIWDLEKKHRGGNKWCLACGKIFDELSYEEKICDSFEGEHIIVTANTFIKGKYVYP